jgi:hypothetical protein
LGSAKTKIGAAQNVETFQGLKTLLNEKCGGTETSTSLLKKLNECKQGEKSVEQFSEQITALTERLVALEIKKEQINDEGQVQLIKRLYDNQALGIFKKGLKSEFQSAVCAAQPSGMEEAISVATEISLRS